jgi:hypothetical protein
MTAPPPRGLKAPTGYPDVVALLAAARDVQGNSPP